jgi:Putative auto-transporter adhesin, head GIN domain
MKIPSFALVPLTALALSGCGYSVFDAAEAMQDEAFADGKSITTEEQRTEKFAAINVAGPDNVMFATGDSWSIKAEGNSKAVATLRFKVKDGALYIGREKGSWYGESGKAVTITVTAPSISSVSLAGSGNFRGDKLSGDKVSVDLAGSGNVDIADVQSPVLKGEVAGSGDMKLAGKSAKASYSVAGSGDIDAAAVSSEAVDVSVAGSGNANVSASKSVEASIAGSGDVNATGGAKCTSSVVGSGKLNCS